MARKIKVLHFPIQEGLGGVRSYVMQNWAYLDHTKVQFDLITRFVPDKALQKKIGPDGCIYPVTGAYAGNEEAFWNKVSKILDGGYDVVHLHTSNWFGGFPFEEMAVQKKIPRIIVHAHSSGVDPCYVGGDYNHLLALHEHYKGLFHQGLATDFFACSQTAADWIFPQAIPRERIRILKNAIDVRKFAYSPTVRNEYRYQMGFEDAFVVGVVARFSSAKNPHFILNVFRALHNITKKARLVWVGAGPLMDEVRTSIGDLGDAVCLLGEREDVPALMQAFDCLLLPSLFEGLGIVLIEAQASGLPCLASLAVPSEVEVTNRIMRLSLEDSAQCWAEQLLSLAEGRERRDLLQDVSNAGYDLKRAAAELQQFYLEQLT